MNPNEFKPRFSKIKGLSDRRRLPRLGMIRLGLKAKSKKTGKEYPREVDYFVVPNEVERECGEKPKELDVMIPINDIETVFPMAYKHYGASHGLKCSGNGETAYRVNPETNEMMEVPCPCQLLDEGQCKQSATLNIMIPKVSVGGVYQLRTSSYNSIIDIQSGLDYVAALIGRFAMVPLKLRRIKTDTHHDGKKQAHYTMQIIFDGNIDTINALRSDTQRILEHPRYALPAPLDESPEADPPDILVDEETIEEEKIEAPEAAQEASEEIREEEEKTAVLKEQLQELKDAMIAAGYDTQEKRKEKILEVTGKDMIKNLTVDDCKMVINNLLKEPF